MDKYVTCSRCKYKLSFQYKSLRKVARAERIDFLDFLCSHCKNEILRKHKKYIVDEPKHVVSQSNSFKTTPSVPNILLVTQHERDDKDLISTHPPKKFKEPKTSISGDSKESVATYNTVDLRDKFNNTNLKFIVKERGRNQDKYLLTRIRENNIKRYEHHDLTLSEEEQEYYRFWFPEKDFNISVPIQYSKNRSSTEIIRDMFEKEGIRLSKATKITNTEESIRDTDWSTKIAEKYATKNKLKCFDVKSDEIFDQNKNLQISISNTNGKLKALDIAKELDKTKKVENHHKETIKIKVDIDKDSIKKKNKTTTMDKKLSKQPKRIVKHEKVQERLQKESEVTRKREEEKYKKQTDNGVVKPLESEEDKKHQKDTDLAQSFNKTDADSLVEDARSKEVLKKKEYQELIITETKSDEDEQEIKDQQNNSVGEVDELVTVKNLVKSKNKTAKKSKEPKRKVSKIDVRDPNIKNNTQSLLKDIIKSFERNEISEDLNPKNRNVSNIDVAKRDIKKEKKPVKLSDNIKVKDSKYSAQTDQELPKGTTRYALSDQNYIDKGWTKLPTEKTVRKMIRYKMKQPHPEFDWFKRNKHKKQMFYNTGEKLADFEDSETDYPLGEKVHSKKGEGDHSKKKEGGHSKKRDEGNSKERDEGHSRERDEDHMEKAGGGNLKKRDGSHSQKREDNNLKKDGIVHLKKENGDHLKPKEAESHIKKDKEQQSTKEEYGDLKRVEKDRSHIREDGHLKKEEGDELKKAEDRYSKKDKGYSKKGEGDMTTKKNKLYYRNGKVALEQYVPEEENNERRIVVYSKSEPELMGRPGLTTVLATFDHLGNGVVYDHDGNVRLKYNQTEGVLLDKTIGPVTRWKWHTLNDPPELKDVMNETTLEPKDMNIARLGKPNEVRKIKDEEIQAIAMQNFIKSKQKKFKPYPIKMKAVKINENFSLKVVDQATIYLNFRDQEISMRTNVGLVLDHKDILDTDLADMGDVSNSDRVPKTLSLAMLQSQRRHVQRLQRKRLERMKFLRLKQSSTDKLYAVISKPRHKVIKVKIDKVCQCDLFCEDYNI